MTELTLYLKRKKEREQEAKRRERTRLKKLGLYVPCKQRRKKKKSNIMDQGISFTIPEQGIEYTHNDPHYLPTPEEIKAQCAIFRKMRRLFKNEKKSYFKWLAEYTRTTNVIAKED